MLTLTENEDYKDLMNTTEIYRLILDMRVYREIFSSSSSLIDKTNYIALITHFSNLFARLEQIISNSKKDCTLLSEIPKDTFYSALSLTMHYKNENAKIKSILDEQRQLAASCPNTRPFIIELCEFISACLGILPDEYIDSLMNSACQILHMAPVLCDSELTEYMLFCSIPRFFDAYFLKDSDVVPFDYVLNRLLKKAPTSEVNLQSNITLIAKYTSLQPSIESLSYLLKPFSGPARTKARTTLETIHACTLPLPLDLLNKFMGEKISEYIAAGEDSALANLFEGLLILCPPDENDWIATFITTLRSYPNGHRHLKVLASLLGEESRVAFDAALHSISDTDEKILRITPIEN